MFLNHSDIVRLKASLSKVVAGAGSIESMAIALQSTAPSVAYSFFVLQISAPAFHDVA